MGKRRNYAFMHIEKVAGTSLIHEIRRRFVFEYADVRPLHRRSDDGLRGEDIELYQRFLPGLRFIGGHSVQPCHDLHLALPSLKYITVLRNPVDRLESHFIHWRQRKGFQGSFDEFVALPQMQNFVCRKITGGSEPSRAIGILEKDFIAVGVFEHLSAFYAQLRNAIPEFADIATPRHVNMRREKEDVFLSPQRRIMVEQLNRADMEIYRWAMRQTEGMSDAAHRQEPTAQGGRHFADYTDYALRKLWIEPVSGAIRLTRKLPYRGSYQVDVFG